MTHEINVTPEYFSNIKTGIITFHYRPVDNTYTVGDRIVFKENGGNENPKVCHATITRIHEGADFGFPKGYFTIHWSTYDHIDFEDNYQRLVTALLPEFEKKLTYKRAGDICERIHHVLSSFDSIAANAIIQAKNYSEDFKVMLKGFEMIIEGIGDSGNHSQKRVIANHCISMIRQAIDKINRIDWEYSDSLFDRYDYFRSTAPEKTLLEKYRDLKQENERLKTNNGQLVNMIPEDQRPDLPF